MPSSLPSAILLFIHSEWAISVIFAHSEWVISVIFAHSEWVIQSKTTHSEWVFLETDKGKMDDNNAATYMMQGSNYNDARKQL